MSAESAESTLGSIEFTTDIGALKDVDFVVEAVVENIDLKRDLYTTLGDLCKPETIFASNTSSLSIGGTQSAPQMTTFQLDLVCDILSDSYFFRLCLCGQNSDNGVSRNGRVFKTT